MSTPIITVENLGKKYTLDHRLVRGRNNSLREVISDKARSLFRAREISARPKGKSQKDEFWALKDVNFEVKEGETIGIVGRNGAGKSTLLKILSRITEPTSGRARLRGRVASLLEVGTGFHPELTGRENIFLNGAILGMPKSEIKRNFDKIVDFAGVERFLDTPVKRYSSGMYVRLAFAVAAHIETEILIIDEVLAVGDAQFQNKCIGKMEDVAQSGRTVIFVSHNMNAVEELCKRAILLESGSIRMDSIDVRSVLREYLFGDEENLASVWESSGGISNQYFSLVRLALTDREGRALTMPVRNDCDMWVEIVGDIVEPDDGLDVGYAIFSEEGTALYFSQQTDRPEREWTRPKAGRLQCRSRIPSRFLNEGSYRIEALVSLHLRQWLYEPQKTSPYVLLTIRGGLSDSPSWMLKRPGVLAPLLDWEVRITEETLRSGEERLVSS